MQRKDICVFDEVPYIESKQILRIIFGISKKNNRNNLKIMI